VTVTAASPNGIYDVMAAVMDRSGNSFELSGTLEVQKNQVEVTVAVDQAAGNTFNRVVTFTATDVSGAVLKSWTPTVSFVGGVGSVTLHEAPDGMVRLSAKTAWNLRVRLDCQADKFGQSAAAFTGVDTLPGGDLNGDNRVNMMDYTVQRRYWNTPNPVADVDGSGTVGQSDYLILKTNWYTLGDGE
jgi:hypothetical protein